MFFEQKNKLSASPWGNAYLLMNSARCKSNMKIPIWRNRMVRGHCDAREGIPNAINSIDQSGTTWKRDSICCCDDMLVLVAGGRVVRHCGAWSRSWFRQLMALVYADDESMESPHQGIIGYCVLLTGELIEAAHAVCCSISIQTHWFYVVPASL